MVWRCVGRERGRAYLLTASVLGHACVFMAEYLFMELPLSTPIVDYGQIHERAHTRSQTHTHTLLCRINA